MVKINLRTAIRMKNSAGEIRSIKGPGFSWNRPPRLSDFYGIGENKIAIHISTEGATVTGGLATGLTNLGGAGAMFNAVSNPATGLPIVNEKFVRLNGAANRFTTANEADILNVRMFTVMSFNEVANGARLFGAQTADGARYEVTFVVNADPGRKMLRYSKTPPGSSTTAVQQTGWLTTFPATGVHILETELTNTTFKVLIDGVQIASVATVAGFVGVPYWIEHVGAGTAGTNGLVTNMGDIVGVTLGQNSAEAITVARVHLAKRFGLTLT